MKSLIEIELKKRLRSSLTWFAIIILIIISVIYVLELKDQRSLRTFNGHNLGRYDNGVLRLSQYTDKELYPRKYYSEIIREKGGEELIKANEEHNIKEITRLMSFEYLIVAKSGYITNDPIINTVFYNKVIDMWNDVSGGVPYEDIDFYPQNYPDTLYKYNNLLSGKYYYQLYKNDFEPIYKDDVNNITYLYYYFFNIVTKFIVIIPISFIYNAINREKNTGSLKLILTQSISRKKYYISKWISGVVHIIFVIIFPPILMSIILGIINGFVSLKYPTIYLRDSLTTLKNIPNYFERFDRQYGWKPQLCYSFNYYAETMTGPEFRGAHDRMEVIPFYKYLLMVILLTILFIAFAVALVQLISAIINKEIISFAVAALSFALGILISSPYKYDENLNLSPFTMENASRIVTGTYNVTAFGSILILSASTILLLIIGCMYFKKKAI